MFYSVHISLIRSNLVLFSPLQSYSVHYVYSGPTRSIQSYRAVIGSVQLVFWFSSIGFFRAGQLKPKISVCKVCNRNRLKWLECNRFRFCFGFGRLLVFCALSLGRLGLWFFFFFLKISVWAFFFFFFFFKCSIQTCCVLALFGPFMLFVIKPFLETYFMN